MDDDDAWIAIACHGVMLVMAACLLLIFFLAVVANGLAMYVPKYVGTLYGYTSFIQLLFYDNSSYVTALSSFFAFQNQAG